jgi:hypothetical protein
MTDFSIWGEIEKILGGGKEKKKGKSKPKKKPKKPSWLPDIPGFSGGGDPFGLEFPGLDLDLSNLINFPDLFNLGLPKAVIGSFGDFGKLAKTGQALITGSAKLIEEVVDMAPKLLEITGTILQKLPQLIDIFFRIIEWVFDRLDWLIDPENSIMVLSVAAATFLGWFMKQNPLFTKSRSIGFELV